MVNLYVLITFHLEDLNFIMNSSKWVSIAVISKHT